MQSLDLKTTVAREESPGRAVNQHVLSAHAVRGMLRRQDMLSNSIKLSL